MNFNFNPKLFNPIFWHIKAALNDIDLRHIYLYGGSSAGKTYSALQAMLLDQCEENYSTIVFRKEQTSIEDTIFNDVDEINDMLQLEMTKQESRLRYKLDDQNVMRFRGVDKAGKVKGLKGYKKILLDELDHFDFEDVKELRRRLRGQEGQQLIYTWNPIHEEHFIKKDVIDKHQWIEQPLYCPKKMPSAQTKLDDNSGVWRNERGNALLIKTTYLDNFYVVGNKMYPQFGFYDKHTIEEFEEMRDFDDNDYRVYCLGEYGINKTGFEYYGKFSAGTHVREVQRIQDLPLHITFDFNTRPYMTLNIWQIEYTKTGVRFRCIDEYSFEPPKNTIEDLCEQFLLDYEDHIKKTGVFVYGDTSGDNDIPSKVLKNYYDAIIEAMQGYVTRNEIRLLKSNPLHKLRRREINKLFWGRTDHDIVIDENCKKVIQDLEQVQQDANGKKLKKKTRVKYGTQTVSVELIGHHSDAMDYFLCYVLEKILKIGVTFNSRKAA